VTSRKRVRPRESRLFAALAVIALTAILAFLPGRFQPLPKAVQFLAAGILAGTMLAVELAPTNQFLIRIERYAAAVLLPLIALIQLGVLSILFVSMTRPSGVSGLTLLTSSIAIWATNVLVFALAYWHLDRGGPSGRASGWRGAADFTFPRGEPPDGVPEDWQPVFADYLALAFNTSTAFSPTDVLPLRPRAKMLMVTQSLISLVTVIAVGARAINILGTK
jgi:hypothetical protein